MDRVIFRQNILRLSTIKSWGVDVERCRGRSSIINVEDGWIGKGVEQHEVVPVGALMSRFDESSRSGVVFEVDGCDVVDAGPPLVLAPGELPQVVLLSMACYLRRCFGDDEVS